MMDWLKALPNWQPYGDPRYFGYLVLALVPIVIAMVYGGKTLGSNAAQMICDQMKFFKQTGQIHICVPSRIVYVLRWCHVGARTCCDGLSVRKV